jgi:hypothetical protein
MQNSNPHPTPLPKGEGIKGENLEIIENYTSLLEQFNNI